MNPFLALRDYLRSLARGDEPAEPEPEKKRIDARPVVKTPRRTSQGDGFDAGFGGTRVDLSGGLPVPVLAAEEPPAGDSFIQQTDFNASLDDLPALLDEPLGEQPEFIPEGGMSTQNLMREFDVLDPELIVPPPAAELVVPTLPAPAPMPVETLAPETPEPVASPAPSEAVVLLPIADLAEFPTSDSTFAFDDTALAESSFESEPSAAEPAQVPPVSEPSSFEESSFEPAPDKPQRLAPAWLIEPTVPKKPVQPPTGPAFSASFDDLGLPAEEPAPEPESPESTPSPARGEGDT